MMRKTADKPMLARTAALLLLLAVAGLSTLAMHTRYLPKSNPLHFFSKATKMNVEIIRHSWPPARLYSVAELAPPRPEFRTAQVRQPERVHLQQIGLIFLPSTSILPHPCSHSTKTRHQAAFKSPVCPGSLTFDGPWPA